MNAALLEIIIIFLLILLNGFFSMSEIAVVTARKGRLQQVAGEDRGAKAALELADSPSRFLSTVQVGITLVGIFTGAFGGATLAREIALLLDRVVWLRPYSPAISVGIVVLVTTYFLLVLGELVPKRLAMINAERIASFIAPFMMRLSEIARPAVYILTRSTEAVVRLLGIKPNSDLPVTEEEVRLMIEEGTQFGVFEPIEKEMVGQLFWLSDRTVSALITPRTEIVWLDTNDSFEELAYKLTTNNHSRFPLADGSLDNVLGMIMAKDLLGQLLAGEAIDLEKVLQPPLFVPEGMPALQVLDRFKEARAQFALVIDEYGVLQGLVTINDLLEELVGNIPEANEELDPEVVEREDGSWLLDGMLTVDEFKELFSIDALPDEEIQYHQTLGGFVMAAMGRIPTTGDKFDWSGLSFEVVDMDGYRVDKVLVRWLSTAQ
jgi:putative hemolysin